MEGFRCLVSTSWIPIKKTITFTGQNDGGKTSALDALALLVDRKAEPDKRDYTIVHDGGSAVGKILVEGIFALSSDDRQVVATRRWTTARKTRVQPL